VCAVAAYAALTIVLTWPLVLQLGAVVPKDLGDPLFSTWALWWNARVVPFSAAWWHAPIFVPAGNAMALADHRVGLGLITTPLILAGASPLAAYGVAFLSSYVASAASGYALCLTLGTTRPVAFLGGLMFGFHPFRAAHLEHIELLSSYWLALTLLCLHRWVAVRSTLALAGVSVTLLLQALTSGYYYVYSGVLVAGWAAWFAWRDTTWRDRCRLGAALAAPVAVLAPVLWRYRQVHDAYGLSRTITEIEQLSADIVGLVTPPAMLAVWNSPWLPGHAEGALFPGVTAVVAVLLALWLRPTVTASTDRWHRWRMGCGYAAVVLAGVGVVALAFGPFTVGISPVRVSVSNLYKPMSVAALFALGWLVMRPRVGDAWRRGSPFAFYGLATLVMWALALGPTARLFGERVLYKAPYAWLMALPGFADEFRAPARFAMLAALTLSVAAALAIGRLTSGLGRRVRAATYVLVAVAVAVDGWIEPLPLPAPPPSATAIDSLSRDVVVLELPLGAFADVAAMYRAMAHGHPLVNGYSGYEPPHYTVLRTALADGQTAVLGAMASDRDLAVIVAPTPEGGRLAIAALRKVPSASTSRVAGVDVVAVPRRSATPVAPTRAQPLALHAVTASTGADDIGLAVDGDLGTTWKTPGPQAGGEQLRMDLGELHLVAGLELRLGKLAFAFPRRVRVEVSGDGATWREVWRGETAPAALEAARQAPAVVPVRVHFPAARGRYVRVTQEGTSTHPWAVAELAVLGSAAVEPNN
jgi:hypothetical protein